MDFFWENGILLISRILVIESKASANKHVTTRSRASRGEREAENYT